jgi:heat shock protein HslJ
MIYLRISAILAALLAVFLLGMWLTWPELAYNSAGFPINRNFVAVSLNGEPLRNAELPRPQTLQARRESMFRLRAFGYGGCNGWTATLLVFPPKSIVWGDKHQTLMACGRAGPLEERYLDALLAATRWRREERTLILENDTHVLRFMLAPP